MRRLWHAAAAAVVVGLSVLVPAAPASAAPGDLCTPKEWFKPKNFARCADGLKDEAAERVQCLNAPTPTDPASGFAGWTSTQPDAGLYAEGVAGMYTRYGAGGYGLSLYDITCAGAVTHGFDKGVSKLASGMFALAGAEVGVSDLLRGYASSPSDTWAWADDPVNDVAGGFYELVFHPLGGLVLLATGAWLIWTARKAGKLAHAMRLAGWMLLVMLVTTAIGKSPIATVHIADEAAGGFAAWAQSTVGPPAQTATDSQCVLDDPKACQDHRSPALRASDTATETLLYRNWLRATLGDADSPVAQQYGLALYDARTLSWDEAATIKAKPDLRPTIVASKQRQWMKVAAQIKAEDPAAYEHLRGVHPETRLAAAFAALVSTTVFTLFDVFAALMVLWGFLVFRWVVAVLPFLGAVALCEPVSAGWRKAVNWALIGAVQIVAFSVGSAVYLRCSVALLGSDLNGVLKIVVLFLLAVAFSLLCWVGRNRARLAGWYGSPKTVRNARMRAEETAGISSREVLDEVVDHLRRAGSSGRATRRAPDDFWVRQEPFGAPSTAKRIEGGVR